MKETRMEEGEGRIGKMDEDLSGRGGSSEWRKSPKIKTYLDVGDGQVNVSPWRMMAPFEDKNQLDLRKKPEDSWWREKIKKDPRDRKTRKWQKPTERYRNRKQGRQWDGKNHSEVFFQIKYRQTGKEWTVRGSTGRDNEELFFLCFFSKSVNLGCSISAKKRVWWCGGGCCKESKLPVSVIETRSWLILPLFFSSFFFFLLSWLLLLSYT